jgi:hypothetical protein
MKRYTLESVIGGELGTQAKILALQGFNWWANKAVASSPLLQVKSSKHASTDASTISLDTFRDLVQLPESESLDDKRVRESHELDTNLSIANATIILGTEITEPEYDYHVKKLQYPVERIVDHSKYMADNNPRLTEINSQLSAITAIDTTVAKVANKKRQKEQLEENIRYRITEFNSVDNREELMSLDSVELENIILNSDLNDEAMLERFESSVMNIVKSIASKGTYTADADLVTYGNNLLLELNKKA